MSIFSGYSDTAVASQRLENTTQLLSEKFVEEISPRVNDNLVDTKNGAKTPVGLGTVLLSDGLIYKISLQTIEERGASPSHTSSKIEITFEPDNSDLIFTVSYEPDNLRFLTGIAPETTVTVRTPNGYLLPNENALSLLQRLNDALAAPSDCS